MPHQEPTLATTPNSFADPLDARYVVERELGRGGMAVVYLAADAVTGEHVALKVIHPELGAAVGGERFRQEIRIASSLSHPHILPVLEAGLFGGQLSFVMPVVTGESLHARLAREGQLSMDDALRITREIASALDYAHGRGIVHRDVKPENILLQDGHALLADFGIARASTDLRTTQTLTRTGMSIGTPAYMSPEQSTAERDVDGRSDQYSLACVLYEMLVGQAPFTAKTAQAMIARHLMDPVPSIAVVRATVPAQVEGAIGRALAKVPADRFAGIAAFAEALGTPETWAAPRPAPRRRAGGAPWLTRRRTVGALGALGLAGAFALWQTRWPAEPTPLVLLAVAPFNALRDEFKLWEEGMVDVLARNLDGAGPLETVSPAVAIRGWGGKSDRTTARALARRTKAQYAMFGSISGAPGDLVKLSTSLVEAATDSMWAAEWTGRSVQDVADSASVFVLRKLGEKYAITATRDSSPLARVSFEALKAFLEGEQHFRRTAWSLATSAYTRAVALDTSFALPLRRLGQIDGWQRDGADSARLAFALRAGALNYGLAPRDSFLVVSDSLLASLSARDASSLDWRALQRLFATVNEAARRYPNDPEVWFTVGEARAHLGYGAVADVTDEQVFDAFSRAIALDAGYAPAYIHAVELAFQLRGRDAGRRYTQGYLALNPTDEHAHAMRLVARVTDPARADTPETAQLLDTLATHVIHHALLRLRRWPDSSATALALVRAIARRPSTSPTHAVDSGRVQSYLPLQLAYRGRLREAYEALGNRRSRLFAELVLLGGIRRDTADAVFARWLADGSPQARLALPYWAAAGDSTSIRGFERRVAAALDTATGTGQVAARHDAGAGRAYLALARRDTTAAMRAFAQLSDTLCLTCYLDRLTEARLLAARGRLDDADRLLRQRLYTVMTPAEVWIAVERGRVARRRRDRETAVRAYRLVVDAWSGGDAEVQPMVREARDALRALGAASREAVATVTGAGQ